MECKLIQVFFSLIFKNGPVVRWMVIFFWFSLALLGQSKNLKFEVISIEEGLSQSTITCILQDDKGFLWFGTQDGLNRYDGYTFKVFTNNPEDTNTISHSFIVCLYQDREGYLWIGTDAGGLDQLDLKSMTIKHFRHDENNPHSLSHNSIKTIFQDQQGTLWIGTRGGGLNRFNPQTGTFTLYKQTTQQPSANGHDNVLSIVQDAQGYLWLGTQGGLDRFNPKTGEYKHFYSFLVNAIYKSAAGFFWIATADKT